MIYLFILFRDKDYTDPAFESGVLIPSDTSPEDQPGSRPEPTPSPCVAVTTRFRVLFTGVPANPISHTRSPAPGVTSIGDGVDDSLLIVIFGSILIPALTQTA